MARFSPQHRPRCSAPWCVLLFAVVTASPDEVSPRHDHSRRTVSASSVAEPSGYRFRSWTTENGLPGNWVDCLAQTPDGYLWIGTRDGLVRFDGMKFTMFEDVLPAHVGPGFAKGFALEDSGTLWIATKRALLRRDASGFSVFTKSNGLAHPEVSSVCVSRNGGVWIGTGAGVNRYANGKFRFYSTDTLSAPFVYSVLEDSRGTVWVGTIDGLLQLDPTSGDLETIWRLDVPGPWQPENGDVTIVRWIFEDRAGDVWFATDELLLRARDRQRAASVPLGQPEDSQTPTARWRHVAIERVAGGEAAIGDRVKSMHQDRDGGLWLVKQNGLYRITNGVAILFEETADLTDVQLNCVFQDRESNYWFGTAYGGLVRMQPRALKTYTTSDGLAHNEVWSVCPSQNGGVWVATIAGVSRFRTNAFEPFRPEPPLPESNFRSIIESKLGDLWLGAASGRFWQLRATNHFEFVPKLAGPEARVNYEDWEGNIWTGTSMRLFVARPRSRFYWNVMFDRWFHESHGEEWVFGPGSSRVYWDGRDLFQTNGRWRREVESGTRETTWNEIVQEDTTGWTKEFPQGELSSYDVRAILQDRAGAMWFGTAGGLNYLADRKFNALTTKDGLVNDDVLSLCEDRDDALWIGTRHGLSRLTHEKVDGLALRGQAIAARTLPPPTFFSFTTQHGLFDNTINAIVEDDYGNLWFSCPRGIFRVRRQDLNDIASGKASAVRSIAFDESDGMLSTETASGCQPAACKDGEGKLWFPTKRGVVVIEPERVVENNSLPPVLIEAVRTDDVSAFNDLVTGPHQRAASLQLAVRPNSELPVANRQHVAAPSGGFDHGRVTPGMELLALPTAARSESAIRNRQSTITLPAGSGRRLEIDYTAQNFSAPEKVRFRYRLEGHDREWIEAGTRRTAYYANLPPGQYRFQVSAGNKHNVWKETGAMLAFNIQPHLHERWSFRFTAAFLVLGFVAALVLIRLRELRRVHALEQQAALAQERRRIARDLHDHIGSQLTRLVVTARPLETDSPETSGGSTGTDERLAEEALHGLDQVIWLTDPGKDTLQHTVDYLCRYARGFFAGMPVQLRLDVPLEIPAISLSAATRHALIRVVQEALANVAKHAAATEVLLPFRATESALIFGIEDNGRGFDPNQCATSGNGLGNMRERIEEIGGTFAVFSAPGRGTRITIELRTNI